MKAEVSGAPIAYGRAGLIPPAVAALASGALTWITGSSSSPGEGPFLPVSVVMFIAFGPLVIALLAATLAAIHVQVIAPHAEALGALTALGAERSQLARSYARRSAVEGAIAGVTGAILGTIAAVSGGAEPSTLWLGIVAGWLAMCPAACALAAAIAMRKALPRPATARTQAAPTASPQRASSVTKARVARAALTWGTAPALFAAGMGISLATGYEGVWLIPLVGLGGVGVTIEFAVLVTWLGSRLALAIAAELGRAISRTGATGRIAADALLRPARGRLAAVASIVLVLGGASALSPLIFGLDARNVLMDTLNPSVVVGAVDSYARWGTTPMENAPVSDAPLGWAQAVIDPELEAALAAEPGVTVIPAAKLTVADPEDHSLVELVAIEPADLRAVTLDAPGLFLDGNSTWVFGSGPQTVKAGDVSATISAIQGPVPFNGIDRQWAQKTFGEAPTSLLLLYLDPSVDPEALLARHGLDQSNSLVTVSGTFERESNPAAFLTVVAALLAAGLGIVLLATRTSLKARAHDYATLAALGATRAQVGAAVAIEVACLTASAGLVGVTGGLLVGEPYAMASYGVPLRLWAQGIGFDLTHIPIAGLGVLVAGATALAVLAAAAWTMRLRSSSPVDQLRDAIKEGAR